MKKQLQFTTPNPTVNLDAVVAFEEQNSVIVPEWLKSYFLECNGGVLASTNSLFIPNQSIYKEYYVEYGELGLMGIHLEALTGISDNELTSIATRTEYLRDWPNFPENAYVFTYSGMNSVTFFELQRKNGKNPAKTGMYLYDPDSLNKNYIFPIAEHPLDFLSGILPER